MVTPDKENKIISFPQFHNTPDTRGRKGRSLTTTTTIEFPERAARLYQHLRNPREPQNYSFPIEYFTHSDATQFGFITLDQNQTELDNQKVRLFIEWPADGVIIDLGYETKPEISHLQSFAYILVPHDNHIIAELAGVGLPEALEAVVALNWPNGAWERQRLKISLIKLFEVNPEAVRATFATVRRYIESDLKQFVFDCSATLASMDETADSLSWKLLQKHKKNLTGKKVVVLAGREHRAIFEPDYQPPEESIVAPDGRVEEIFALYAARDQKLAQTPRAVKQGIKEPVIGVDPETRLEKLLNVYPLEPGNENLREELNTLLKARYRGWIMSGHYHLREEEVKRLQKFGIENANMLFAEVLFAHGEQILTKLRLVSQQKGSRNYVVIDSLLRKVRKVAKELQLLQLINTEKLWVNITELEKRFYPFNDGA